MSAPCPRCRFEHDGTCTAARADRRKAYLDQMRRDLAAVPRCGHGAPLESCRECAGKRPEAKEAADA